MRLCSIASVMLLAIILVLPAGCGNPPAPTYPEAGADANSAVDYVDKTQMGKPLGGAASKYKPGSAKSVGADKVQIEDLAGKKYEVTVTPEGKTYKTSEPKPVN